MTQVLEYIMQYYTWFLGGAILILLAIIGYYADKTNFGQGKNPKNDENNKDVNSTLKEEIKEESLEKVEELDVVQNDRLTDSVILEENEQKQNSIPNENELTPLEYNVEDVNLTQNYTNVSLEEIDIEKEINVDEQNSVKNETDEKNIVDASTIVPEVIDDNSSLISEITEEEQNNLLSDEEFDKFSQEFNLVLPKKELIDTDLLSDIEDFELGKTQKLDLNDIPDLDDIELPKIKQLDPKEQDIWKF